jgi:hypothetical protein
MISLASLCASGADRSTVLQVGFVRHRGSCRLSAARLTTVRIGGSTGKSEWPLPGRRESSLEQARAAGEGRFEPTNRRPANGRIRA